MTEIKRYDVVLVDGVPAHRPSESGRWVKHDDHSAIVAALQEQVRALAAEANYLRNEIKQHSVYVHFCEACGKDDPCKTDDVCYSLNKPLTATDAVIREIRAQAVDDFGIYHNFSDKQLIQAEAKKYAARIRSGEQP